MIVFSNHVSFLIAYELNHNHSLLRLIIIFVTYTILGIIYPHDFEYLTYLTHCGYIIIQSQQTNKYIINRYLYVKIENKQNNQRTKILYKFEKSKTIIE